MENRKQLPDGIYVNEVFPYEIAQRRSVLQLILKLDLEIPECRGKIMLSYDKLIVSGKAFTMGNINELPENLNLSSSLVFTPHTVTFISQPLS